MVLDADNSQPLHPDSWIPSGTFITDYLAEFSGGLLQVCDEYGREPSTSLPIENILNKIWVFLELLNNSGTITQNKLGRRKTLK